jgi:hypothetical protein
MNDSKKHVEELIAKAARADDPADAMKLSQAALNAANAIHSLKLMEKMT